MSTEIEQHDQQHDAARRGAVEIVVNARPHDVTSEHVTYEEVVSIAFPQHSNDPNTTFTVTYHHAKHRERGSLVAGGAVEAKRKGTTFDVVHSGKS